MSRPSDSRSRAFTNATLRAWTSSRARRFEVWTCELRQITESKMRVVIAWFNPGTLARCSRLSQSIPSCTYAPGYTAQHCPCSVEHGNLVGNIFLSNAVNCPC